MTYTPINWQTGDTITADKMNKMDNGWSVEDTQLFSETVTTIQDDYGVSGNLSYNQQINAAVLIVTFNDVEYTCNANDQNGNIVYGGFGALGPDFTEYPFIIMSRINTGGDNIVITQTAGSYTISASTKVIEVSDDFNAVVNNTVESPNFKITPEVTTWQEAYDAIIAGKFTYWLQNPGNEITSNIFIAISTDFISQDNNYIVRGICYSDTDDDIVIQTLAASTASDALMSR